MTSSADTEDRLRSPEVAHRLGIPGPDVYQLLFDGELEGGRDEDGRVYFSVASVEAYAAKHAPSGT